MAFAETHLSFVAGMHADVILYCAQVPNGANGGQPNDTWISGQNGAAAAQLSGQASQDQLNNEQLAAAQGQAGVSTSCGSYASIDALHAENSAWPTAMQGV